MITWLSARLWRASGLLLLGVASLATALNLPEKRVPVTAELPDGSDLTGWAVGLLIGSIVAIAIGLISLEAWREGRWWKDADRRAQRIDKLSDSLKEALHDIESIQREVAEGTALLAKLEEDAATKAHLAQLSDAESEAVRNLVSNALRRETNRGTWLSISISVVFFALGIVAGKVF